MFMIFDGNLFQSLIVLGQKLYLYSSHDVQYWNKLYWVRVSSFHYSFWSEQYVSWWKGKIVDVYDSWRERMSVDESKGVFTRTCKNLYKI